MRWIARSGEEERIAEILAELAPLSRAEPGCVRYEVFRVRGEPTVFQLVETYVDEAALESHFASPHVQRLFFEEGLELLESRVRTYLEPIG